MAKFMVVDDSKISRKIIGELISELGHSVGIEASSGEEAIEKYDSSIVDCILMDIEMGGISGVEATKILTKKYSDINIIIVCSVCGTLRLKEMQMSGAKGIVQKPATVSSLASAISKVL